ncbi:MAG: ATP-binding protein, partial [Bacteroidales bacterium]
CRIDSTLPKFFDKMADTDLIILDDFGMKVLDGGQILEFMELIEDRHQRKSTIIVSQLPVSEWYGILSANTTAADAILDRIVHTAMRFELKGVSLRKK